MVDLSKEWVLEIADETELAAYVGPEICDDYANLAQALRIAARVLDEGAVERLAGVIDEIVDARTSYNEEAYIRNTDEVSQAVINYLLEGKE